MTEQKHTPGPWTAKVGLGGDVYQVATEALICGEIGNPANARLIAAAPALLDALRRASGGFEHHPACVRSGNGNTCNCAMNDVREAIRLATEGDAS